MILWREHQPRSTEILGVLPVSWAPPSILFIITGIPKQFSFPHLPPKSQTMLQNKNQIYSADIVLRKSYKSGPPQFQTLRCEVYVNSYIWRMNKPLNSFLKMGLATLKSRGGTSLKAPSSFTSVKPAVSPLGESHFKNSFTPKESVAGGNCEG